MVASQTSHDHGADPTRPMRDHSEGHRGTCLDSAPYLLGALRPVAAHAFEEHLIECGACQDACDDLGPIATALSGIPTAEAIVLLQGWIRAAAEGREAPPARTRRQFG